MKPNLSIEEVNNILDLLRKIEFILYATYFEDLGLQKPKQPDPLIPCPNFEEEDSF